MDAFRRRLRHLFRSFARQPGFAAVIVVTLALGIGANAAIFSVVDGILIRSLPYPDPGGLVDVAHLAPGIGLEDPFELSDATYLHYRATNRTLEEVGIYVERPVNLTGEGEPERLPAALMTASVLPVLGVAPARGQGFVEEEERPGAEPVALLSHGLWRRRYGGDPEAVGRTVRVDGVERRVIGVMPEGFAFPEPEVELWLPLPVDPADVEAGSFSYRAVARLRPEVTPEAARQDLDRALATLTEAFPGEDLTPELLAKARFATVVRPLAERVVGDVDRTLWVLLGAVGVILLVACANVANLVLVRAEGRGREVAVRTALGAGRGDLAADFLAESVLLALAGGALGVVLAYAGVEALTTAGPQNLPRLHEVAVDGRVLAFTAAVSVLAGLLFGLAPVVRFGAPRVVEALKDGGRGATTGRRGQRTRNALVVVQVALALVLLVGSGLLVRSFAALRNVDPGFDPGGVLAFRLALPRASYPEGPDAARFYDRLLERLRALPGVEAVGAVQDLPLGGSGSSQGTAMEDFPREPDELPMLLRYTHAGPGYFEALGIPLLAGRTFVPEDHEQPSGAAVISAALARRLWPGASPLGKRLRPGDAENGPWYRVVGVVGSVRDRVLVEPPSELVYYPMVGQEEDDWVARSMTVVMRTGLDPLSLVDQAREEVWSLDPGLPIAAVQTMERVVSRASSRTRFTMLLLLLAAGMTLVLGAVGLYGVVSYAVSQRTQEIGVRMALGARREQVRRMVVRQGLLVTGAGIALGLAAALGVTRLLAALLYEVGPSDPSTFAAVVALLAVVAAAASFLPARRAAAVEPVQALRHE